MKLNSDFRDYYDKYLDDKGYTYNRYYIYNKIEALKILRDMGIKTITICPLDKVIEEQDKLVVYINLNKHNGEGKALMNKAEARLLYPNKFVSKFYAENDNKTYKILQIGDRRFAVVYQNIDNFKLGKIIQINELERSRINQFKFPIYSIDYIKTKDGMIATDFNTTEILSRLHIDEVIEPKEIIEALNKYFIN